MRPHRQQPSRLPRPWDSPGKNTGVGCHFLLQCMKVKSESEVAQSCLTLSDPKDCSLPGSSVHGIFQARVLEWGAIAFSHKKNEILPFATMWMDHKKSIMLSELSQTVKDKYSIITCMWNLKKNNKWMHITKQKQSHRYRQQAGHFQWGEGRWEGQDGVVD